MTTACWNSAANFAWKSFSTHSTRSWPSHVPPPVLEDICEVQEAPHAEQVRIDCARFQSVASGIQRYLFLAQQLICPSFFNSSLRFVASRLLLSLPRPLEPVAESGYDDHGAARKAGGSGLTAAVRSVGYFRPHPAAPAPAPPHPPQLHEMMCETLSCNAVSVFTVLCISVQGGGFECSRGDVVEVFCMGTTSVGSIRNDGSAHDLLRRPLESTCMIGHTWFSRVLGMSWWTRVSSLLAAYGARRTAVLYSSVLELERSQEHDMFCATKAFGFSLLPSNVPRKPLLFVLSWFLPSPRRSQCH